MVTLMARVVPSANGYLRTMALARAHSSTRQREERD